MNARTKAQLRPIIATLEGLRTKELAAEKRHAAAGLVDYQKHAAWCAEGIGVALKLLEAGLLTEAANTLAVIEASQPTDDLPPHQSLKVSLAQKSPACSQGNCNHPEHI